MNVSLVSILLQFARLVMYLCFIESVFRNLIVVARKQGRIVTCTCEIT